MDQARWIVIFSVLVCMVATLTLLQRFAPKSSALIDKPESVADSQLPVTKSADNNVIAGKSINYGQIKYSEPPAHVFSVGNAAETAKEAEMMSDDGKILE